MTESRPPLLTIALLSAAALGYEILLMRLFSIIQWHHFAYMIISLALLGYGASGTYLAFAQKRLLKNYPRALITNLALFGLTAMPAFLAAQQIAFNPEELLWDWRQPVQLMFIYLILSLPFLFTANAIALTMANFRTVITHVYAVDLLGAGTGSLAVIGLLYLLPPLYALSAVSVLGLACIAVAAVELGVSKRRRFTAAALTTMALMVWLGNSTVLSPSPYKGLSQTLRVDGARIINERHSPLGLLHVVENNKVPLRYAPGMSLNALSGPPPQLGIYSDGDGMGSITRNTDDPTALAFLDQLSSALPYHLGRQERVLILGAGGGMEILQALYQNAAHIDAVELNPQVVELLRDDYAEFSGQLYSKVGVHIHTNEARGFVSGQTLRYNLIQPALHDSPGTSSAGIASLSESYIHTTEALQTYIDHLSNGGYLVINQWIKLPPRNTLKLFATAIDALKNTGVAQPGNRMLLIRGWQTSTLLVKNGDIDGEEIRKLLSFCRSRSFDVAWYPGISSDQANRYNRLREPYFYQAAQALLGPDRQSFMDRYKFNLQPATDDQPYFHNFFKWSTLREVLRLRDQGGIPLLEAGYPVLVATLVQALLLSTLLILVPLAFLKRKQRTTGASASHLRVIVYFGSIGLAFLFLEIAFIQKFMLFLHHPLFTAAVVLASFLVFAGLGSNWSQRRNASNSCLRGTLWAIAGILVAGASYLLTLDILFAYLANWPMAAKMAVSCLLIAPLAFFMGMPFPLALSSLGKGSTELIPLAWGVNGCASVISAVLATLLAIHLGFSAVVVGALLIYLVAAAAFPSPPGQTE